jgi:hypothetical protein
MSPLFGALAEREIKVALEEHAADTQRHFKVAFRRAISHLNVSKHIKQKTATVQFFWKL